MMIVSAQSEMEKKDIEIEARKLDSLHAAAVLSGDLKEMDKYWTVTCYCSDLID